VPKSRISIYRTKSYLALCQKVVLALQEKLMISLEQKLEIRALHLAGFTNTQIGKKLDINIHTIRKWVSIIKKRIFVF